MKLVDILARELDEWPVSLAQPLSQDADGVLYVSAQYTNDAETYRLRKTCKIAKDMLHATVSHAQWQAARAAYLASIQPERDAEITQIVESALQTQQGGTHYKDLKIQPIEYIHANGLDFFQGNIVKYATRHKDKNGAEDLRKVIHYAQLAIELQYGEKP